jgi:nicotinamide mononucleotide (NMN) deamidase PncC
MNNANSSAFIQGFVLPQETSQRQFLKLKSEDFDLLKDNPKRLTDSFALKVRNESKTDLGLALSGKITEKQGEGEYKIETYTSLSTSTGIEKQEYALGGELWMVRERASIIALDMLRKYLLKQGP